MNYHDRPEVSATQLKCMAEGWRQFEAEYITKIAPFRESAAMELGTAIHMALLEPELFAATYAILPVECSDRRTKAFKEFAAANSDANFLSPKDYESIKRVTESVVRDDVASRLLCTVDSVEKEHFWTCQATGVKCRAKTDAIRGKGVIDIKTTDDARPRAFARKIADFRYDLQAAHYLDGTGCEAFLFVAIETTCPWRVRTYTLLPQDLLHASTQRLELLEEYKGRLEVGNWSERGEHEVADIYLPKYFLKGNDNE
jgi:exodeoxyribonuclease VIII